MIYGRHKLMVLAAVRYCLGRQSYMVGDCCDWLIWLWPKLDEANRKLIQRDVDEAFESDDAAREDGNVCRRLGMDIDRKQWERVRALWKSDNGENSHE